MAAISLSSEQEYWWRTCEPAISHLMDSTGSYTEEQKQRQLKWFASEITPWFGKPHTSDCGISLTNDKSPIELSLNLKQRGKAMVRYGIQLVPTDEW